MARIQFSNIAVAMALLISEWDRHPLHHRVDLHQAKLSLAKSHARFYGGTSKYKPHVSFGRAQRRYAARIASGKIPRDQIIFTAA